MRIVAIFRTLTAAATLWLGLTSLARAEQRAFVVGISKYDEIPASFNSTNDAVLIKKELQSLGFREHITFLDESYADFKGFRDAWTNFLGTIKPGDDVLVYFSGHGFSYRENNYLALRDMSDPNKVSRQEAISNARSVEGLSNELTERFVRVGVFILEACRDDPFGYQDHSLKRGTTIVNRLEPSTKTSAIVVWYAASEGETSLATSSTANPDKNSLFTGIFAQNLNSYKSTDIERFAKEIRLPVLNASPPDHQQHPWLASNLTFDWCFGDCPKSDANPTITSYGNATTRLSNLAPVQIPVVRQVSVNSDNYQAYITQSRIDGNAIFMGKKSAAINCHVGENDNHPFGCGILIDLAKEDDVSKSDIVEKYLDQPLTLETADFLHLGLPTAISADAHAKDTCRTTVIGKGAMVTLSSIVALNYDRDTFYWGILKARNYTTCPG